MVEVKRNDIKIWGVKGVEIAEQESREYTFSFLAFMPIGSSCSCSLLLFQIERAERAGAERAKEPKELKELPNSERRELPEKTSGFKELRAEVDFFSSS